MRIYEELFILRPDTPEEAIDAYVEQLKQVIVSAGGTVDKADKWGLRKLAYRVQKRAEGHYVLLQFSTSSNESVKEIERRMRVTDFVMKFITVRIDEKLKKLEKRTKLREKRARRKPLPAAPAPAAAPAPPAEPAPAMPGPPAEPAAAAAPAPPEPAAPAVE